jgi:hypothetical protein
MSSSESPVPSFMIEVSPGELLDRISILEIKSQRIGDPAKLRNIHHELGLYRSTILGKIPDGKAMTGLARDLKAVNETLWTIEDEIRACEANQDFGKRFVELARSVYRTNDRRASIKREINVLCGSTIIEEKSYTQY